MGKQFIQKDCDNMKSSSWSETIKHSELQNAIINHINGNSDLCCSTNELGYSFANCMAESSNNFTNNCCSIRSNAVSINELENLTKRIDKLELDLNKKIETTAEKMNREMKEIDEKLNWQTICLYLTWGMLIVLGFMICFKSFDVSIEVNNPIPNQEVILEHE